MKRRARWEAERQASGLQKSLAKAHKREEARRAMQTCKSLDEQEFESIAGPRAVGGTIHVATVVDVDLPPSPRSAMEIELQSMGDSSDAFTIVDEADSVAVGEKHTLHKSTMMDQLSSATAVAFYACLILIVLVGATIAVIAAEVYPPRGDGGGSSPHAHPEMVPPIPRTPSPPPPVVQNYRRVQQSVSLDLTPEAYVPLRHALEIGYGSSIGIVEEATASSGETYQRFRVGTNVQSSLTGRRNVWIAFVAIILESTENALQLDINKSLNVTAPQLYINLVRAATNLGFNSSVIPDPGPNLVLGKLTVVEVVNTIPPPVSTAAPTVASLCIED